MATLWIFDGETPREFTLQSEPVTIGRVDGNTIRLNDRTVSKKHACIEQDDIGWKVTDLGSSNGTFLDGREILTARLISGLRLRIGATEFVLDDTEMDEDGEEFAGSGSIMTSIPAIPGGFLDTLNDEPTLAEGNDHSSTSKDSRVSVAPRESLEERKLRLIREVGEALLNLSETTAVAQEILRILTTETKADRGFLCQFREDGSHYPLASFGVHEGESIRFSRTVISKMMEEKSGVLIRQTTPSAVEISSLKVMNVQATLCVPLWTRKQIMGFVILDMLQEQRGFTTTHLDLLVAVAHQAALGVERSRFAEAVESERKRRDYLCQYLDHKIIQSVLSNQSSDDDPLAAQEKEITILFCDIVSFTKMSEHMPPADLARFVRDHLTAMTEILFGHDGTIDKYIGDAVMALFGAPVANPESATNAVRAAMEMKAFVSDLVEPSVRLRFGIATGPVIVGNIGSAQRVEYTALGDTVNVASRLEGLARPSEIVIDDTTRALLGPDFQVEEIGTIEVKNRIEPVQVFKVLSENML